MPNDLIPDEIAIKTSPTNHQLLPTPLIGEAQPVIYRFNQSTNISAHLQAFQIDPDFNTLKIFTLTLISKTMKVFTTTTTTTTLYDIPLFYY